MASISPNLERLQAFAQSEDDTPIMMINLVQYRDQAEYEDDADEPARSGREAYAHYSSLATRFVGEVSGKLVFMGGVESCLIAPEGEDWDAALLVQYPSRQAFIAMLSNPEYQAITFHRTAALADSRLIATTAPSHGA